MTIKRFAPLILAVVFIFLVALVNAQDDQGNPNNPTTNPAANACYTDGEMASKCDTAWEWVCGWYMIRFDYGELSRNEVPEDCQILIPPDPTSEPEVITPEPTVAVTIPPK